MLYLYSLYLFSPEEKKYNNLLCEMIENLYLYFLFPMCYSAYCLSDVPNFKLLWFCKLPLNYKQVYGKH